MATLFRKTRATLEDLKSIENNAELTTEPGPDSHDIGINAELLSDLETLALKVETDLEGKKPLHRQVFQINDQTNSFDSRESRNHRYQDFDLQPIQRFPQAPVSIVCRFCSPWIGLVWPLLHLHLRFR